MHRTLFPRILLLASLIAVLFGCQSADEKANEELVKSRNSQAQQMNTHGAAGQTLPTAGK